MRMLYFRIWKFFRHLFHPGERRVKDCVNTRFCRGRETRHGRCINCGDLTCSRSGYIDDAGRRRIGSICPQENFVINHFTKTQTTRRRDRRLADMEAVTVPPENGHMKFASMPDQYAGLTRDAIRSMLTADESEAVVDGIGASTLNASIRSTGLEGSLYAETRDGLTVLRKVDK